MPLTPMGKKEKRLHGKGGEVKQDKMKDESGGRVKKLRREGYDTIREVSAIENAGLPLGKRNRGLRRQPLRKHK